MKLALFFGKTATQFLASVRPLALLTALLLAPWGRLSAQAQALPSFTYAGVCGEGTVGFGNGLRIAQNVQDTAGNSYVTGCFLNRATFGTFLLQSPGYSMFVTKLDPAGVVMWAVRADGTTEGQGIAVDAGGNVFVTGGFEGVAAFGSFVLTSRSNNAYSGNAFVAKLSPTGTFLWAVRGGGNSDGSGSGIVIDAAGNSYVCGTFRAIFNTADFGQFSLTSNNNSKDLFIAKISPLGTFLWAIGGGGSMEDYAGGITLDATGSVYIAGAYMGIGQFGTINLTNAGDYDVVVAKLDPAGNFQWAAGGGGSPPDIGQRIAVDALGIVHVVGYTMSARPVFGAITLSHPNQATFNAIVATLTPAGTWQWVVQGGGPGDDYAYDLALDAVGNTYAVGSCSYRATFGNTVLTTAGDQDVMVSK